MEAVKWIEEARRDQREETGGDKGDTRWDRSHGSQREGNEKNWTINDRGLTGTNHRLNPKKER